MGKILQFSNKTPAKFGFERVKKRKKGSREFGQLNLFTPQSGRVLHLPTRFGPFEEALVLDEQNDPRAVDAYWRAIEENDGVADAYCNLGILESRAGRTAKAIDCFTHSLRDDPRHCESHFNLANLYFDVGNLKLAQLHYEIAAEVEPEFPNIFFNLGLVHALNENFSEAIAALTRYQELAPEEAGKADNLLDSLHRSLPQRG